MPFSDDDLKRLKELLESGEEWKADEVDIDLIALLARLLAAENVCRATKGIWDRGNMTLELDQALEAWRKAAGK